MVRFLLFIIMSIISTFGLTFLFCKVSNINKIPKFSYFIFIIGVFVITFFKYFNIKYYNLLSYFIIYPLLFYSISKNSLKSVIVSSLTIWLIGILADVISMLISSLVCYHFDVSLDEYYNIFSIILTLLVFLFFILIGLNNKSKDILKNVIKYFCEIDYINYILIAFCIFILILSVTIFLDLERIKIDFLIFIIIILSLLIFVILIKFKIDSVENKKYLKTLKENNDFYIKMDDENRIFKHNLVARLSSIKSVSNKKAIALIDDFVIKNNKGMNYSKKMKTIPYGLNGIIYQKTYPYLEELNFKLSNKIGVDIFKLLRPRRYNVLVEKLIVSLDNAIDASLNSKNKVVVINLYDDEDNIYVEIKNSFAYNLDIDNLGTLNYSTKGKRRGLGLFSALRDNEATLKVKVVNNYFISIISARKQK